MKTALFVLAVYLLTYSVQDSTACKAAGNQGTEIKQQICNVIEVGVPNTKCCWIKTTYDPVVTWSCDAIEQTKEALAAYSKTATDQKGKIDIQCSAKLIVPSILIVLSLLFL